MRIQIRNTAELKLPILYIGTGTRKTKHSTDLTAQGPEGRLKRCKEYQPNNMLSLMKKEQKQKLTKLQKNSIGTPYEYQLNQSQLLYHDDHTLHAAAVKS